MGSLGREEVRIITGTEKLLSFTTSRRMVHGPGRIEGLRVAVPTHPS